MKTLYDSKGTPVQVQPVDVQEYIQSGEYSLTPPETESNASGALRTDGPTVAQYVEAGYQAKNYPPNGYESKSTDEEIQAAIKAQEEAEAAKAGGSGSAAPAGQAGGESATGGAAAGGNAGEGAGAGSDIPAIDDITVAQIKERLAANSVVIPDGVTLKADLYKLLKGE